jgi:MFS family permease
MASPFTFNASALAQHRTLRAFHNPDYRLLWPANLLSYTSRWMQMTILGWLVLQLTDSPWHVALVGFFGMAPMLVLGLVGGLLADTANRKTVILSTQVAGLGASTAMLALLITGSEQFWHAYVIVSVTGTSWALEMPSRRSAIHDLLGSSGMTNGVAMDSVGMSASRMIGPALAGLLISTTGFIGAYVAVVVSYLTAVALLWRFTLASTPGNGRESASLTKNLVEGLRYVWGHPALRATVTVTVLMNLLMFPYQHLVPVISRDILGVGPAPMGVLLAGAGMGAMIGAVLVASATSIRHHGRLYIGGSALSFVALLLFATSRWYSLSLPALVLLGLGTAGFSTMQASIVMFVARMDVRGKALGVVSLAIGASPIGALMEGVVADILGPEFALGINATAGLVCMALVATLLPALRRPMTPDDAGTAYA